jgi:hypothetical protein
MCLFALTALATKSLLYYIILRHIHILYYIYGYGGLVPYCIRYWGIGGFDIL